MEQTNIKYSVHRLIRTGRSAKLIGQAISLLFIMINYPPTFVHIARLLCLVKMNNNKIR